MVSQLVPPRNEERLRRGFFGWEVTRGVQAAVLAKLYWKLRLTDARPLQGDEEDTGGWVPFTDREQGITMITGTLSGPVAYEDVAILLGAGVSGESAGVTDAGSTPAFLWAGVPSFDQDNLRSMTVETGAPDDPYVSTMLMMSQFTLTADTEGQGATWMINANVIAMSFARKPRAIGTATAATTTTLTSTGAGWSVNQWTDAVLQITGGAGMGQERRIVSNTATAVTVAQAFATVPDATSVFRIIPATTVVTDRTRELIRAKGTKVYIDDVGSALATTQMLGRVISFSVTVDLQRMTKAFLENVDTVSAVTGRGSLLVTFQLRLEWDRERIGEAMTEHAHFQAGDIRRIVIEQSGKVIHDTVRSKIRIVLPKAKYGQWSDSPRQANMAIQFGGECFLDALLGYSFAIPATTRVASVG